MHHGVIQELARCMHIYSMIASFFKATVFTSKYKTAWQWSLSQMLDSAALCV